MEYEHSFMATSVAHHVMKMWSLLWTHADWLTLSTIFVWVGLGIYHVLSYVLPPTYHAQHIVLLNGISSTLHCSSILSSSFVLGSSYNLLHLQLRILFSLLVLLLLVHIIISTFSMHPWRGVASQQHNSLDYKPNDGWTSIFNLNFLVIDALFLLLGP